MYTKNTAGSSSGDMLPLLVGSMNSGWLIVIHCAFKFDFLKISLSNSILTFEVYARILHYNRKKNNMLLVPSCYVMFLEMYSDQMLLLAPVL